MQVKKLEEGHTCTRSNMGGNKRVTQGWIANIITDKLKSDGDISPMELRKWNMKTYNVNVPYLKVFRGKEQAYTDMHGKWEDSFMKMDVFREELLNRNKCPRCGEYEHREKTCKNPALQDLDPSETSTSRKRNRCP